MVHLRPGRIRFRLASRRDASFFEDGELPPLRKPRPGRPARIITRAEEKASNAAWVRAALHQKFRGQLTWTEATGLALYGALFLLLLGRHMPDGPQEGLPLLEPKVPLMAVRGGADAATLLAEASLPADAGAETAEAVPGVDGLALPRSLHGTGGSAMVVLAAVEARAVPGETMEVAALRAEAAQGEAVPRSMPGALLGGVAEALGELLPASFRGTTREVAATETAAARMEAAKAAAVGARVVQAEAAAKTPSAETASGPATSAKAETASAKAMEPAAGPKAIAMAVELRGQSASPETTALQQKGTMLAGAQRDEGGVKAAPVAQFGAEPTKTGAFQQNIKNGTSPTGPDTETGVAVANRSQGMARPATPDTNPQATSIEPQTNGMPKDVVATSARAVGTVGDVALADAGTTSKSGGLKAILQPSKAVQTAGEQAASTVAASSDASSTRSGGAADVLVKTPVSVTSPDKVTVEPDHAGGNAAEASRESTQAGADLDTAGTTLTEADGAETADPVSGTNQVTQTEGGQPGTAVSAQDTVRPEPSEDRQTAGPATTDPNGTVLADAAGTGTVDPATDTGGETSAEDGQASDAVSTPETAETRPSEPSHDAVSAETEPGETVLTETDGGTRPADSAVGTAETSVEGERPGQTSPGTEVAATEPSEPSHDAEPGETVLTGTDGGTRPADSAVGTAETSVEGERPGQTSPGTEVAATEPSEPSHDAVSAEAHSDRPVLAESEGTKSADSTAGISGELPAHGEQPDSAAAEQDVAESTASDDLDDVLAATAHPDRVVVAETEGTSSAGPATSASRAMPASEQPDKVIPAAGMTETSVSGVLHDAVPTETHADETVLAATRSKPDDAAAGTSEETTVENRHPDRVASEAAGATTAETPHDAAPVVTMPGKVAEAVVTDTLDATSEPLAETRSIEAAGAATRSHGPAGSHIGKADDVAQSGDTTNRSAEAGSGTGPGSQDADEKVVASESREERELPWTIGSAESGTTDRAGNDATGDGPGHGMKAALIALDPSHAALRVALPVADRGDFPDPGASADDRHQAIMVSARPEAEVHADADMSSVAAEATYGLDHAGHGPHSAVTDSLFG